MGNLVYCLAFIYFLSLSIDLINVDVGIFKFKLSHAFGLIGLGLVFSTYRSLIVERKTFLCFAAIFGSMIISSFGSEVFYRSFTYSLVWVFTYFCFFLVPLTLVQLVKEERLFKIYICSFLVIGAYAAAQFFFSIIGITLPFSSQKVIFIRGSALAHEPSFYTLYAIPFVTYLNSKYLFLRVLKKKEGLLAISDKSLLNPGLGILFTVNLFLLVSTSTSAFISYFVFCAALYLLANLKGIENLTTKIRKKVIGIAVASGGIFFVLGMIFYDLFKKTFLKFFYSGLGHESFADRFKGIVNTVAVFLGNPLFGVGHGGVSAKILKEIDCPEYGHQMIGVDRLTLEKYEPTNVFTEILGSFGLIGCACFLLFVWVVLREFLKFLKDSRHNDYEKATIFALLISIVVMLICMQINMGLYRCYVWAHLGVSYGYLLKLKQKAQTVQSRAFSEV